MSLYVDSSTRERLVQAQRALLAPLAYDSFRSWQLDVNRYIRDLVRADHVVTFIFDEDGVRYHSDDTDTSALHPLRERFIGYDAEGFATFEPETGHEAGSLFVERYHRTRRTVGSAAMHDMQDLGAAAVKQSDIFQETHVDIGLVHMMGLAAPMPIGEVTTAIGFERKDANGYSEAGLRLLEILVPAYEAGVQAWRRSAGLRATLGLVDEAIVVFGPEGTRLFESRKFAEMMRNEPLAKHLCDAMEALASTFSLSRSRPAQETSASRRPVRQVPINRENYFLWASPLAPAVFGVDAVVVGVEKAMPTLPTPKVARQRFGLTPRQAEVALLIAKGLDNKAVAERLFISPHTARRHTEWVLKKLGVPSRSAVALRLMEPVPPE